MSDDHKADQDDLQKPAQENTSGGSVIAAKRKARNRRAMVMKTKAKTTAPGESATHRGGVPIGSSELLDYLDENWDDFKVTAEELTEEEQNELQSYFTECNEDFEDVGEALWGGHDDFKMIKSVFDSIRDDKGRD